jgi:hypothetical protein
MSANSRKKTIQTRTILIIACGLLIIISLITFLQQVPALSERESGRAFDQEYIDALRHIGDILPQNETLAASEIYPQATYFTDHKVKTPWVRSEKALVQFMWKNNCSYLLVPQYTFDPRPDNTPLLVQWAKKPFVELSDFYAKYISVSRPQNTNLLNNISDPRPDDNDDSNNDTDTRLNIRKIIHKDLFNELFYKVLDYPTEDSIIHLYKLRSNITRDNLSVVTDKTRPMLSVSLPLNGTIMESEFGVLRVNVTGSAIDADTDIKGVEISIDGSRYQLANPRTPDDWSTWSYSDIVTEGTNRILVRATDNADNRNWAPVYVTVR